MELVYITHGSLAHAHFLAPALSWLLVVGAVYGLLRLVLDVARAARSVPLRPRRDFAATLRDAKHQ